MSVGLLIIFTAIVVGDYLYIDGGEISHMEDGTMPNRTNPSHAISHTLSIPLGVSWDNQTVDFNKIPKPSSVPILNNQAAWRDPSGSGFYIRGGVTPYHAQPLPSDMWKFTTDGSGGGFWAKEKRVSSVALSRNIRTTHGAWT
ncbi:hypothetical protein QBC40DRAFT_331793 [Triangularia verruculosa]|uniref:Uncharacterized protein n=1 Tax=Triangularia verruculosa TaxID=2587418 RepID=A0AAN7ARB5_9PEZI|nr:hypothetical protein QBC40DRAFT_331793 [Triangularia verruculosa]